MKFEFKLQPGEPTTKEPPRRLNPFDLLKTRPASKEVVSGFPVFTDAFGRTLYENSNGQFRAIGEEFDLVANVSQLQNNLITLAPQPDDEEEDTMPKQKPKRKAGGIIIPTPVPPSKFDFIYIAYSGMSTRIFKTDVQTAATTEIFQRPPGSDVWWAGNGLAMGFHDQTAIAMGFDEEWAERLYQVGYTHNVINSVVLEPPTFYTAKFTIYSGAVYFAAYKDENVTGMYSLGKGLEIKEIRTYPKSVYNVEIWKNYIAYILEHTFYIYDYINDKTICALNIEYASLAIMTLVDFSNDHACFVITFNTYSGTQYSHYQFSKSYFIKIRSSGEYKVWEQNGIHGAMASDGKKTFIMYYPHYFYVPFGNRAYCLFSMNGKLHETWSGNITVKDGAKWKNIHQCSEPFGAVACLSDDEVLLGTYYSSPSQNNGGRIIKYQSGVWADKGRLGTSRDIRQFEIMPNAVLALTNGDEGLNGSIYHSTDQGESWSKTLLESPIISLHAGYGNAVYGTGDFPLWESKDNGETWTSEYKKGVPYYVTENEEYKTIYPEIGSFWEIKKYNFGVDGDGFMAVIGGNQIWSSIGEEIEEKWGSVDSPVIIDRKFAAGEIWRKRSDVTFTIKYLYVIDNIIYASTEGALYRSADGGNTFSMACELSGKHYPYSMFKMNSDIYFNTRSSDSTNCFIFCSENNGESFVAVNQDLFLDYVIKTYIDDEMANSITTDKLPISTSQGKVGSRYIAKVYEGNFWVGGATYKYNPSTGKVTFEDKGSGVNFIWIEDYVYYVRWDNEISNYSTFARNMKTDEEIRIIRGRQPYFFPEHLATYYLR